MTARVNEPGARSNADVVRETYEAVGRGDIPALLNLLTEDVEWTLQGSTVIPFAGTRHGDTVAVLGYERSLIKPTGRTLEQEWAHLYKLRDGKIAEFRAFEDTAALVVAFDAG